LRADLHNLFDAGLLWIDDSYRVHMAEHLRGGHYGHHRDRPLRLPCAQADWPDKGALGRHRRHVAGSE
jgi:hypothetical protein